MFIAPYLTVTGCLRIIRPHRGDVTLKGKLILSPSTKPVRLVPNETLGKYPAEELIYTSFFPNNTVAMLALLTYIYRDSRLLLVLLYCFDIYVTLPIRYEIAFATRFRLSDSLLLLLLLLLAPPFSLILLRISFFMCNLFTAPLLPLNSSPLSPLVDAL